MRSFIISLDFELFWGVRDSRGSEYHQQLRNVQQVVPRLLTLFEKYEVAGTWATVGALCAEDFRDFVQYLPEKLPSYTYKEFSPFNDLDYLSSIDTQLVFAPQLVKAIVEAKNQEFASHTFSHYYALEQGQSITEFESDLDACTNIIKKNNLHLQSLVFPRNQFNREYLSACKEKGYIAYRGNPLHWAYKAENRESRSVFKRLFRLIDSYIPLSGSLRQHVKLDAETGIVDVPASIFFRPYSPKLHLLDRLKLWRLKWSMTRTAKKGGVFHLWWHPHNFGQYIDENLIQIEELLKHYCFLNNKYDFESLTMAQAASRSLEEKK